jgi:hypothetical protein
MSVIANREMVTRALISPSSLKDRHARLQREMICQLERSMALENHWLIYTLLGWEHLVTCALSFYLVEVAKLQYPFRWPYALVWFLQILAALVTVQLVRGRPRIEESPLKPIVNRVWGIFLLLCCNVAVLNVVAELPVFTFLPVLATLSSFAFLVLSSILSRRFIAAALAMFVAGTLMARFPAYGFLIYGAGWLVVLQSLGVIFYRRRRRWLVA